MMAPMSLGADYTNPYELTALQIAAARAQLVFRSRHRRTLQQRLQDSDALVDQVEHCRIAGRQLVDAATWGNVVRLVAEVDPRLRRSLGSRRDPGRVGEVLFAVQARLMEAVRDERCRGLAPVIPLFPGP
jgi:hypothetical protein